MCTLSYVHIQHIWTLMWHTRMCMVMHAPHYIHNNYPQQIYTLHTCRCTNLSPGITQTHLSNLPYWQTRAHTCTHTTILTHVHMHARALTRSLPPPHTQTHAIIMQTHLHMAESFAKLWSIHTSRTWARVELARGHPAAGVGLELAMSIAQGRDRNLRNHLAVWESRKSDVFSNSCVFWNWNGYCNFCCSKF